MRRVKEKRKKNQDQGSASTLWALPTTGPTVTLAGESLVQRRKTPYRVFFFLIYVYLFIWLCRVLVAAGGLLSCSRRAP